jgi:hypothetical protein
VQTEIILILTEKLAAQARHTLLPNKKESTIKNEADPIVGNWYQHLDKGQAFQVVAVDEDAGTVELQHFDGDVEEIDLDAWYRLPVELIEEPENWSGPFDVGEMDDLTGTEVTDTAVAEWTEPLEEIVKPEDRPVDVPSEEGDNWDEGYPAEEPLEEEPAAEKPPEESEEE